MSTNAPVQAPGAKTDSCPNCGSQASWGSASWCPTCGYYPQFAKSMPTIDREEIEAQNKPQEVSKGLPEWMWVLIAGVVVIGVGSLAMRAHFYFNGGRRGTFAFFEMLVGACVLFGAHTLALVRGVKKDRGLGWLDAITNPIRVWQPTIEGVPETAGRLQCAAWGAALMIAANLLVGGIRYSIIWESSWGFQQPKETESLMKKAIRAAGGIVDDDGDALEELQEAAEEMQAAIDAANEEPDTVKCFVYGYLADEFFEAGRILVARKSRGKLRHCATIKGGDLSEKDYELLMRMLTERATDAPAVASRLNANWVEATIEIELTTQGTAKNGELLKPEFYGITLSLEKIRREKALEEAGEGGMDDPSLLPGDLPLDTGDQADQIRSLLEDMK